MECPEERIALEEIKRQGVTIIIKAPRDMDRSSLLHRITGAAKEAGKQVVFLDFEQFDKPTLTNASTFFLQFCIGLTEDLELDDRVDDYWKMRSGNIRRCTHYMGRYLLRALNKPLVLAVDNVDSIFDSDFRSDFFRMLRNWNNNCRVRDPVWKQLDLVLVTSFELYQLIDDPLLSFNVNVVVELTDFMFEQVKDLNRHYGPLLTPGQERQLMALLGGHPRLVCRALSLVAQGRISPTELFIRATDDHGPFGDHLRALLLWLYDKEDLTQGLRQVIHCNACQDERVCLRLQSVGLVRREGPAVLPRCQLYADYFRERLNV